MAQSRLISSDIWSDDWFGPLPFFDQALWIGLFSQCADDQGRLLDNPVLIRAAVFPYKDIAIGDIEQALARFTADGKLVRYQADGKRLIQLANWWDHQRHQWAQASKWPAPEGWHDAVRTRVNGEYHADNWTGTRGYNLVPSGEPTTLSPHLGRQDPDPDPAEDPDPDPNPAEVEEGVDPSRARASRADAAPVPTSPSTAYGLAELVTNVFDADALNADTPHMIADMVRDWGEDNVWTAVAEMNTQSPRKRAWSYVRGILEKKRLAGELVLPEPNTAAAPPEDATSPPSGNGHGVVVKPWKMAVIERRAGHGAH